MNGDYFAGRLKELREQAGLTQQQLAERAGMNKFGIAKLEQGKTKPWWESVLALAHALGVTPNDFTQEPASRLGVGPGRPRKESADAAATEPTTPTSTKRKAPKRGGKGKSK